MMITASFSYYCELITLVLCDYYYLLCNCVLKLMFKYLSLSYLCNFVRVFFLSETANTGTFFKQYFLSKLFNVQSCVFVYGNALLLVICPSNYLNILIFI